MVMVPSSSAKILVGIDLDTKASKDILSWAIRVLAKPDDTIVALHVLVCKKSRNRESTRKQQSKIRLAKAHVISVLGELAGTCQSKQIHLEAKVNVSSSMGRGLIEEAQSTSADYLLLLRHGLTNISLNRNSFEAVRYSLEHAPETCTVISIGKCQLPEQNSDFAQTKENHRFNSMDASLAEKYVKNGNDVSPTSVMDDTEEQSQSTSGTSSFRDSTMTFSESPPLSTIIIKQKSLYKTIYSFLKSTLKERKYIFPDKEKHQTLLSCFSYEEISIATNNFDERNMVGKGGYSEVFRGDLSDGVIAVKRLAKDNENSNKNKEFLNELGIIGHICHPNTAKLVGYCIENGLYLVFDFSQNGNLESALHGKSCKTLEWHIRVKIAMGVARGLHYLHKCCNHRIIHRDIKSSNVLLGPDYDPQITDFGLAKWLPNKWSHQTVVPIEGTFGYLAPEYFMQGIVDEKTDVFAFGVLLLEIVTGRRPVDSSRQNLLLWAKPYMESGNIAELVDPKLEGEYDTNEVCRLVQTSKLCVRRLSSWRPSMIEVLELLGGENVMDDLRYCESMPIFACDEIIEMDDYDSDEMYT